ncbi:rho GTPase-activating protein 6-like isoform X2 [Scleropages formosus]|uniref:rho GTPase-activating protein 6-like isoform X2 n=1 Tax=Scleropages formosus TaxID=113540 RepID=UPI0010FA7423|nr:rho GTPase-activating protein 6-like isoform X2 [Scleropages formosus]
MGDHVFTEKHISYQGDFTWNSMSGRSVRLKPVAIQSLSELERARLQEVALGRLLQDYDLGCQITIPKDGHKRKKSLRRKLDSLSKEKNKDKEFIPQAFGMPLSQVIANDRAIKQRLESAREGHRDASDLVSSILQFATKRSNKELSSSNSSLSSTSETPNEVTSPNTPEVAPRARRRGAVSVDSITDLDDNHSRLLEALQLSLPAEAPSKKEKQRDKKLSLNPIYRQVPRLVDSCCQHLEKYGLQTVGIFRVGSSKKRVRQLREEFDRGADVRLDEEHSVHDVAALLKEFLRDMPDPLLTRELYAAFVSTMSLSHEEQHGVLQLLIYLLPPCNSDTLQRLLRFLSTVAAHAPDAQGKDGQEVTGNKMTSLNLATIFGPNLLHKTKISDKEFSVQSSARAEESTAIIGVVQKMIAECEDLFLVPPDLQNEVLMSLLETDPDVVDYLLRRKASQWSNTDMTRSDDRISLDERHFSSDSNKASSGDVSPYDNNSPVLPDRLLPQPEKVPRVPEQSALVGDNRGRCREPWSPQSSSRETTDRHTQLWGAWHATLKSGLQDQSHTGSCGNLSRCGTQGSGEGLDNHLGKRKVKPHPLSHTSTPPASCSNKICQGEEGQRRPRQSLDSLAVRPEGGSASTEDPRPGPPYRFATADRIDNRPPPPYPGPPRTSLSTPPPPPAYRPMSPASPRLKCALQRPRGSSDPQRLRPLSPAKSTDTVSPSSLNWQDWQRERWQIWQLLSSDSSDALPETLV